MIPTQIDSPDIPPRLLVIEMSFPVPCLLVPSTSRPSSRHGLLPVPASSRSRSRALHGIGWRDMVLYCSKLTHLFNVRTHPPLFFLDLEKIETQIHIVLERLDEHQPAKKKSHWRLVNA